MPVQKLSVYFEGVTAKYLSAVDAEPVRSNQHEVGGLVAAGFRRYLGDPGIEDSFFETRMIYLEDESALVSDITATWYDARRLVIHRGPELRLYYEGCEVTERMSEGDFFLIAKTSHSTLMIIVTPPGSTAENQIRWLFGLSVLGPKRFTSRDLEQLRGQEVGFAAQFILEELDIEIIEEGESYLELLKENFGEAFPTTKIFSQFARDTAGQVSAIEAPDDTLMKWFEQETKLFRIFEKYIVSERLNQNFEGDVEAFIKFSLSVHNRRKTRAGLAFENHIEQIFIDTNITYSRGKITENKSRPDFLFPDIINYHSEVFPDEGLFMLAAKTTCKDRWRQVLTEARRIEEKHLITLEPGISKDQTSEMINNNLQLVVPHQLHNTYSASQKNWLLSLDDFLKLIRKE